MRPLWLTINVKIKVMPALPSSPIMHSIMPSKKKLNRTRLTVKPNESMVPASFMRSKTTVAIMFIIEINNTTPNIKKKKLNMIM